MQCVLTAETAVFIEFESVRVVLLVLLCVIITLFAFAASKSDLNSHIGTSLENFDCEKNTVRCNVPPSAEDFV